MESIKELRQKLQTNAGGHPYLQRALSIYITRPLLSTNITPNQITVVMLLTGLAGAVALAFGYVWTGFFLSYLCILLDATDGEVARYKKKYSLRGVYLDLLNHIALAGLFFLGITLWVADVFGNPDITVLVIGILGAFAIPLLRANGDLPQHLYVHYMEHSANFNIPNAEVGNAAPTLGKTARQSILYAIYQFRYHAVMIIAFFLVYIAEVMLYPAQSGHPLLSWAVILYAVFFVVCLLRDIFGVFFSLENRIGSIRDSLEKKVRS